MSISLKNFAKSKIIMYRNNDFYYFNIFNLSSGLGYSSPKYLYNYYYKKNRYIDISQSKYIDLKNLSQILNRSRKPSSKKLYLDLKVYLFNK